MTLKEVKELKKGCPYDNACIESFHSSIKKEEIYRNTYCTLEQTNIAILAMLFFLF